MRLNFEDHHIISISILTIAGFVAAVFFIYHADKWNKHTTPDKLENNTDADSLKADLAYQGSVIALLMVLCYLHGKVIF